MRSRIPLGGLAAVIAAACGLVAVPASGADLRPLATSAYSQSSSHPPADIWGRAQLTGDWGRLRPWLEGEGVSLSLEYISELLTSVRGGIRRGTIFEGLLQPQMDVDLEKLLGWSGGRFRLSGVVTHGPDFSPHYLGNILSASNIEVPRPVARAFQLWYEQNAFNDSVSVRAGLMLADSEFITSETAFTFMNATTGWPGWLASDLPAGGPAYPLSTPGARIRLKPSNDAYVQAAIFSGDPSGGDGSNQPVEFPKGTVFGVRGGAFLIAEAGYAPNQQKGAAGLPGTYKIGGWYHTSRRFGDQRFDNSGLSLADPMSTGIALDHTRNWGIYGTMEQMIYRVPGTADQGLSAFFRIGGSPGDRNLISFYMDGGIVCKGLIPGRPDDKIGMAGAYARIGSNARAFDRDVGLLEGSVIPVRRAEALVELTYQAKLAPWWTLQPDLQYILRPNGGVLNDDGKLRRNAWVGGLRTTLSF